MNASDLIAPSCVLDDVRADDKWALLRLLADRAAAAAGLDPARVAEALEARERLGSTGVGGGIALPHARFPELVRPIGYLARLRRPLDFEAVDERPVAFVCLALLPAAREGDQLVALACLSRRLRDPDTLARLREAGDAAELHRALVGPETGEPGR